MSSVKTLPENVADGAPAVPLAPGGRLRRTKEVSSDHRMRLAFFFFLLFTMILYARPQDILVESVGKTIAEQPYAQMAAVLSLITYAGARIRGGVPFVWSLELKLMLAMTAWFWVGLPFAYWRRWTLILLLDDWMKTLLIFLLMTQLCFTLRRIQRLLWVIIGCEFFVAAYTLTTQTGMMDDGRLRGSTVGFLSGNYLGIAAATTLPYIAVLLVRSKSFLRSMVLISTFALLMMMVVRTASRGSIIVVSIGLVLVWGSLMRESWRARWMGFVLVAALLGSIITAPGIFWERFTTLWDKSSYSTSSTALSAGQSEVQRKTLLMRSLKVTFDYPLFGVGIGNFRNYGGMNYGAQAWMGTHNTFTQVSSEAGIPGFLIFMAFMLALLRNTRKTIRETADKPDGQELNMIARASYLSVIAFLLAGFFAHLAYEYYFYYLAAIAVAVNDIHLRNKLAAGPAGGNGKRLRNGNGGRVRP